LMVRRATAHPPARKDTSSPLPDLACRALGEAVPSNRTLRQNHAEHGIVIARTRRPWPRRSGICALVAMQPSWQGVRRDGSRITGAVPVTLRRSYPGRRRGCRRLGGAGPIPSGPRCRRQEPYGTSHASAPNQRPDARDPPRPPFPTLSRSQAQQERCHIGGLSIGSVGTGGQTIIAR
jgi:hypothetical protein